MKTTILFFTLLFAQFYFAQDSLQVEQDKTRLFAFTPLPQKISKVNGIGLGIGMDDMISPNSSKKTINGLNIDVNPVGILILFFYDPSKINNTEDVLQQNGLNISLAGFLRNNSHNGLNISMYNYGNKMNGVSISAIGNVVEEMNGIYVGGFGNYAVKGSGLTFGTFNNVEEFKGIQIGLTNKSEKMKGVQIGLVNKNINGRSFQIGFWNKNTKRTMPILNF